MAQHETKYMPNGPRPDEAARLDFAANQLANPRAKNCWRNMRTRRRPRLGDAGLSEALCQ